MNHIVRLFIFLFTIFVLTSMVGCDAVTFKPTIEPPSKPIQTILTTKAPQKPTATPKKPITTTTPSPKVESLLIDSLTMSNKNIFLKIPHLSGMSDSARAKKINDQIRRDLFRMAGFENVNEFPSDPNAIPDDLTFEQEFEVKRLDGRMLSLSYFAYQMFDMAAHPLNQTYTINYDLSTGKALPLASCIAIDQGLVKKIKQVPLPKDEQSAAYEAINLLQTNHSNDDLLQMLRDLDTTYSNSTSYWTDQSLGLNFETIHALGDFVQIELPLSQLDKNSFKANPACPKPVSKR